MLRNILVQSDEPGRGRPSGGTAAPLDSPFCDIRELLIANPFWTYCANHPHHNPERLTTPVGPVFVCDQYPYARRVLVESPDTEEIRCELVHLLESLPQCPAPEYPSPTSFDEQVVDQLAAPPNRRSPSRATTAGRGWQRANPRGSRRGSTSPACSITASGSISASLVVASPKCDPWTPESAGRPVARNAACAPAPLQEERSPLPGPCAA